MYNAQYSVEQTPELVIYRSNPERLDMGACQRKRNDTVKKSHIHVIVLYFT